MSIKEIYDLLYLHPHRLNDSHVEYLLKVVEYWKESYEEVNEQHKQLLNESRNHSQAMLGNVLGLMLNKPEIFYTEDK